MAKEEVNFIIDDSEEETLIETPIKVKEVKNRRKKEELKEEKPLINCLRNERIIIRHIPRQSNMVQNPKHILYGGMAENATRTFTVPRLSSGKYVNVLTDDEKDFLEDLMGLEPNALSIYKKVDNFWDDSAGITPMFYTI